jgi:hypothetical protein
VETHPQGIPAKPKTSGMAVASFIMAFLPVLNCIGFILGIIALVQISNKSKRLQGSGLAIGGLVISVIIWPVVGILASMLLPTLAKAKTKANRIKCMSNISTINKSFYALSDELDGQTPHLSAAFAAGADGNKLAQALGYSSADDPYDVTRWMSAYSIRQSLYTPKLLASPLDPEAIAAQRRMGALEFATGNPIQVASESQSYAIAMQGDTYSPETVMITTRNLKNASDSQRRDWYQAKGGRNSGDIWSYPNGDRPWSKHVGAAHIQDGGMFGYAAEFHGEDGDEDPQHTMAGMPAEEANWGTSDGATSRGSSSEFNDQLNRAQDNFREGNAVAPGLNLTVLRPQQ